MIDIQEQISLEQIARPATALQKHITLQIMMLSSHLHKVIVGIEPRISEALIKQTVDIFRNASFDNFSIESLSNQHVEESYKNQIRLKVKNYFFQHMVIDFIFAETFNQKLIMANYPRLSSVEMQANHAITYHFDISVADPLELKEWKHFSFKQPKRKKYKDLDKQVIAFIENRISPKKLNSTMIEDNDWVLIEALMVDGQGATINSALQSSFWIKIGHQDVTPPLITQLLGKQLNHKFFTTDLDMNEGEDGSDHRSYRFLVTIKSIIKGSHFSMDLFKSTFKLKNKVDIHNKLMEVFSYRNDVSQRKAIIDEVFHLLLSKHRFEVPKHLVLRREEYILETLMPQPDYHVYKAQSDFNECIQLLAEKQLKEEIVIDHITHHENIRADLRDMQQYLHLISNKRLKEFIYFRPLVERIDDVQAMINVTPLAQAVVREKTLNHIIYTLTH
jgi:FKBP-type peptidyl-prolyl cis-trans isomerase (trigger factor)